jgi:cell division protein FtsX
MRRSALLSMLLLLPLALGVPACGSAAKESSTLVVFLDKDVSADQRTAVEHQVRGMPTVRDVSYKSKQQAYEEFKQQFKDSPDLIAATDPNSLPESYTATVDSTVVEPVETVLASATGVTDVTTRLPSSAKPGGAVGMAVQLRSGISADDRSKVEAALRALPEAKPATYETADAARARLKDRCKNQAGLAAQLDRASPLASYRFAFTMAATSYGSQEYLALSKLSGVQSTLVLPVADL